LPKIPLIGDLTTGPIPAGSALLVEYDPASQWINASLTIAAGWLRTGGRAVYITQSQPPDDTRSQLTRLGLEVEALEKENKLLLYDWYTVTLGQKSKEKRAADSLKIADLSIWVSRELMRGPPISDLLSIADNCSVLMRINEEKSWVEWELTRVIPAMKLRKLIFVHGVIGGIHSEWTYKQLEAGVDGIVDFKLEEAGKATRNLMRIRSMRNVAYDSEWHPLKIAPNFEVTIEK
jgi:KaiC/GvpD/RAD55 family RecA-like ATPase